MNGFSRRQWLGYCSGVGTAVVSGCLRLEDDDEAESNSIESNPEDTNEDAREQEQENGSSEEEFELNLEPTWNVSGIPRESVADEFYIASNTIKTKTADGELRWETTDSIDGHHVIDVSVSETAVVATFHNAELRNEILACYSRPNGEMEWTFGETDAEWGGIDITFSGSEDVVYVAVTDRENRSTEIFVLREADGSQVASKTFDDSIYLGSSTTETGIISINSQSITRYTMNGTDPFHEEQTRDHRRVGTNLGVYGSSGIGHSTDRIVIGTDPIRAVRIDDLSLEWEHDPGEQDIRNPPAVDDHSTAVVTDHGQLLFFETASGEHLWEASLTGAPQPRTAPRLTSEAVWMGDRSGRIHAFSRRDGTQLAVQESDRREHRPFEIAEKTLLARDLGERITQAYSIERVER